MFRLAMLIRWTASIVGLNSNSELNGHRFYIQTWSTLPLSAIRPHSQKNTKRDLPKKTLSKNSSPSQPTQLLRTLSVEAFIGSDQGGEGVKFFGPRKIGMRCMVICVVVVYDISSISAFQPLEKVWVYVGEMFQSHQAECRYWFGNRLLPQLEDDFMIWRFQRLPFCIRPCVGYRTFLKTSQTKQTFLVRSSCSGCFSRRWGL